MSATSAAGSPDDSAMTSSGGDGGGDGRVLRLGGAKSNSRLLTSFTWRRRRDAASHPDDRSDPDAPEYRANSIPGGFFENIKRRLRIKKLGLCKAKQKIQAIDSHRQGEDGEDAASPRPLSFAGKAEANEAANERLGCGDSSAEWIQRLAQNGVDEGLVNEADACWESYGAIGDDAERDFRLEAENAPEAPPARAGNVAEPQSTSARESVADGVDARLSGQCKAKVNLSEELLKLSKHGWYWGPISGDEADSKLVSEPDGAFLVRDSSDDRYLLTLSFKSSGRLLHARMEHSGGLFSLCNQSENEGFTSVAALIDHSMNSSQSAVFCYSRPRDPGHPSYPVRLTKPVSRFTQVRSLQYLCRFVIRQNTRLDNIHKLPLPKTIKGYIEEAHY